MFDKNPSVYPELIVWAVNERNISLRQSFGNKTGCSRLFCVTLRRLPHAITANHTHIKVFICWNNGKINGQRSVRHSNESWDGGKKKKKKTLACRSCSIQFECQNNYSAFFWHDRNCSVSKTNERMANVLKVLKDTELLIGHTWFSRAGFSAEDLTACLTFMNIVLLNTTKVK